MATRVYRQNCTHCRLDSTRFDPPTITYLKSWPNPSVRLLDGPTRSMCASVSFCHCECSCLCLCENHQSPTCICRLYTYPYRHCTVRSHRYAGLTSAPTFSVFNREMNVFFKRKTSVVFHGSIQLLHVWQNLDQRLNELNGNAANYRLRL